MLDKVRNVQFHSWNISSSQNHSVRLLRSWFNHLSKLIFGVGLYSSPFIIVLEDCELNSKVRIELLLPGNVTLCKRQYKSQAALLTTFTKTFELRSILVAVMQKYQIAEKGKFRFSIDNKKK